MNKTFLIETFACYGYSVEFKIEKLYEPLVEN